MPVPDAPLVVQVNWTDVEDVAAWDQPNANILQDGLKSIKIQRNAFHGSLRSDTLEIVAADPQLALRPLKESSPLWPNIKLHRRIRVLKRTAPGQYKGWYFGYLTKITPDPRAQAPPLVTLTAESPLAVLARRKIDLPLMTNPTIWSGTSPNSGVGALATIMEAIQFLNTSFIEFDDVGHHRIDGDMGDGELGFLEAIAPLIDASGCVLACEPRYQVAGGSDVNFVLRWYRPTPGDDVAVSWSSTAGELEGQPSITVDYDDERLQ